MPFPKHGVVDIKEKSTPHWVLWIVLALASTFYFNGASLGITPKQAMDYDLASLLDITAMMKGYEAVPNLLTDSGQWWTGMWIQGNGYLRPLTSYLMWLEIAMNNAGYHYSGHVGVLLLTLNALLAGCIAFLVTRSKLSAALAIVLVTAFPAFVGVHSTWLAWFTYHQDLLMLACFQGALLGVLLWQMEARRTGLYCSWALFVIGCLCKEFVYIFPLVALATALLLPAEINRRRLALNVMGLFGWVGLMFAYRSWAIPEAVSLHVRTFHWQERLTFYANNALWITQVTERMWLAGLALLFVALAWLTYYAKPFIDYKRAVAWIVFCGCIVTAYLMVSTPDAMNALWEILDRPWRRASFGQLCSMVGFFGLLSVAFWQRKNYPLPYALLVVFICFLPVFALPIYFHYSLPSWMMRSALLWPLVLHMTVVLSRQWWEKKFADQVEFVPNVSLLRDKPCLD